MTLGKDGACKHRFVNGCDVGLSEFMLVAMSFLSVNGCDDYPKSGKTELTINVKLVGYSIGLSKLMLVTNVVRPINGNDSCRPFGKTELVNIV